MKLFSTPAGRRAKRYQWPGPRVVFALLPHQCCGCWRWIWLEHLERHRTRHNWRRHTHRVWMCDQCATPWSAASLSIAKEY